MKKHALLFTVLQWLVVAGAQAAPAVPEGWRLSEWWDLDGKDRPILMADFNGRGTVDMATLGVRDDSSTIALLLWYADAPGTKKWVIVDQQKRPSSLANLRFEAVSDEGHPNRSDILLCMTRNECAVFSWDDQIQMFKRSVQSRKSKQ